MYLHDARMLLLQLVDRHCSHMNIQWNRCQINPRLSNTLGRAHRRGLADMWIELSEDFILKNHELHVRDTILHEIAHVLTGVTGHTPAWKNLYKSLLKEHGLQCDKVWRFKARIVNGCEYVR